MMNNYLFKTCGGQFNWNKLMRRSVHLVWSFSHTPKNSKLFLNYDIMI